MICNEIKTSNSLRDPVTNHLNNSMHINIHDGLVHDLEKPLMRRQRFFAFRVANQIR